MRHLFILRGFEQRVFLWAADHLVEGGAGGDHGVDAVFFFYLEVDEEGFAAGAGFCDCGGYILRLLTVAPSMPWAAASRTKSGERMGEAA